MVAHKGDVRFGKVTEFGLEDADKWPFRCLFIGIYTEQYDDGRWLLWSRGLDATM